MRKQTMSFPVRTDTNRAVQAQKMTRGWKVWIQKEEELYLSTRLSIPDLRLCFSHAKSVGFLMTRLNFTL